MIDFRYHVVSIVAVFLALTVGLVIGSSYLSKVAYDELNNQLSSLRSQNQALHGTQVRGEVVRLSTGGQVDKRYSILRDG